VIRRSMPMTIYKIPLLLHEPGLDDIVVDKLRSRCRQADLTPNGCGGRAQESPGRRSTSRWSASTSMRDAYISLNEALIHAGIHSRTRVNIRYIESEDLERSGGQTALGVDAILVPGGFGERGIEGKIQAVRYARENGIPYLGICLGMQAGGDRVRRATC
jgi:CTP synthase